MSKAIATLETNDETYVYDAPSLSCSHIAGAVISQICSNLVYEPPSTTTTTGSFTRDPMVYKAGSNNIYEYVAAGPLRAIDPAGLESWIPMPVKPPTTNPKPPVVPPMPSEENYAISKCYCACATLGALGNAIWPGSGVLQGDIRTESEEFANEHAPPYTSRENSALRHCVAGGMMAARLGCACAQCLEDYRDIAQHYGYGQSWANTQQAIYNDREGRKCNGCSGVGGTHSPILNMKDSVIKSCCLQKLNAKQLYTGNPGTGIPPFPTYPNVWPRIAPPNWWTAPTPQIEWEPPTINPQPW